MNIWNVQELYRFLDLQSFSRLSGTTKSYFERQRYVVLEIRLGIRTVTYYRDDINDANGVIHAAIDPNVVVWGKAPSEDSISRAIG